MRACTAANVTVFITPLGLCMHRRVYLTQHQLKGSFHYY